MHEHFRNAQGRGDLDVAAAQDPVFVDVREQVRRNRAAVLRQLGDGLREQLIDLGVIIGESDVLGVAPPARAAAEQARLAP